MKFKRCKLCKNDFKPRFSPLEEFCWSERCKLADAMQKIAKARDIEVKKSKKMLKEWKNELITPNELKKKAQLIFNKYIRLRDKQKGFNCVSCDKKLGSKYDAGHYYNSSFSAVRFDEKNVHSQCVQCNKYLSGNLLNYQIGIEKRIGAESLIYLQIKAHDVKKWTKDELKDLIETYKEKVKNLGL